MNKSNINARSAGTTFDSDSTAQNQHVSQPNANTNVVGSLVGQREIKFRAWSEVSCKFMEWDFIRSVRNFEKLLTLTHVTLMQYTDLKDKNGKEIYEGDIVEANGHETILVKDNSDARKFVSPIFKDEYKSEHGRFLFVVHWQECFSGFSFRPLNNMVSINPYVNERDFEIVGNIFENPELLHSVA